ncbi:hypothetical protein [Lentzea aerocolonigenes]|uniref:hypothetical protein n=1 Tax=Lentzea aerocolonigenes TaxID=68170 RepID=UPI000B1762A1|nr:hypothetical protein [Lentzea aerocolonigenes]
MIRFARRSIAVVCLVLSAGLWAVPAAQAAPHWKIQSCHGALQAYWLPNVAMSGVFLACATTADRNEQINDAATSGDMTRRYNAAQALIQQNADSFLTPESPCEPGQEAAMGGAHAECAD